ncbi:phosphotransferase-like protein [Pseudactinotalea suaedae]|uniref:phosphotransferase-like protein n=1 Tax=Pseudactinotalea suaedae TaxID=1524924 RepID=UPI0012E24E7F|nr:chloramphenicol phosphotransferase [Pseudactinotalea suaedae]
MSRQPGQVVILNGAPRAGKSSTARALQAAVEGSWIHLGVDAVMASTPEHLLPGIGLRPGGERPDLEPVVATMTTALYGSVAVHARLGLDVVVDAAHHRDYATPLDTFAIAQHQLGDLPVLVVGVRCPLEVIRERRRATWGGQGYVGSTTLEDPVERWQRAVQVLRCDLEIDTHAMTPPECTRVIGEALGRTVRVRS